MATNNYNFTQPNETLPVYPDSIEDISEALDQIDSTIKNISDATSQALGEVDNSFENINNTKIDKSVVTAKGDLIVGLEEGEVTNLPIGEEGQVLTVVLTEDIEPETILQWSNLPEQVTAILTNKGDILIASDANTVSRLGVGTEGQVLKVGATGVPEWSNLPIIPEIPEQMVLTGAELPIADISYKGKLFLLEGDTGISDKMHVCIKDETDEYVWKELNFATI